MRRTLAAAAAAVLIIFAAGTLLYFRRGSSPPVPAARSAAARPPLMLLTTLPLMFPEGFTLKAPPSAALEALQSRYRIVPISVADAGELHHRRLLLMAQPQAQPPEALVDLDNWVRAGGRVLLLADPALEWPSDRPLGSLLRPPFAFADTGLLAHWGLRLRGPDRLGSAERDVDGRTVHTESPGSLAPTGDGCTVSNDGFIARCSIGKGRATVIADADFLNIPSSAGESPNLDVLLIELGRLEH